MFLLMIVKHVIPKEINPEFMNAYSFITFLMVAFSLFLDKSLRKAWRINDNQLEMMLYYPQCPKRAFYFVKKQAFKREKKGRSASGELLKRSEDTSKLQKILLSKVEDRFKDTI